MKVAVTMKKMSMMNTTSNIGVRFICSSDSWSRLLPNGLRTRIPQLIPKGTYLTQKHHPVPTLDIALPAIRYIRAGGDGVECAPTQIHPEPWPMHDNSPPGPLARTLAIACLLTALGGCQSYQTGAGRTLGEYTDDRAIHVRIKFALWDDEELEGWSINVDVHSGVVRLYGPAPSDAARARAERIAASIKGVVQVHNALAVVTE
tara:strand:+ start:1046 stop:1657 length:612 start_codon:yes stop_codon:yes gene_type:complete